MTEPYSMELWDRFDAVSSKASTVHKTTLRTMHSFLSDHTSAEEHHIKALQKACKALVSLPELGTLRTAFLGIRAHSEGVARVLSDAVEATNEETLKPFAEMREEIKKAATKLTQEGTRLVKDLHTVSDKADRARTKAHRLGNDSDNAKQALLDAKSDPATTPQQVQKLSKSANSAARDFEKSDRDYRECVAAMKTFQDKYDRRMGEILNEFEAMEKDRVRKCRSFLIRHLKAYESAMVESLESLRGAIKEAESIDEEADNALFVRENKSGEIPPPHVVYVPFVSKFGEESPGIAAKQLAAKPAAAADCGGAAKPAGGADTAPPPPPAPSSSSSSSSSSATATATAAGNNDAPVNIPPPPAPAAGDNNDASGNNNGNGGNIGIPADAIKVKATFDFNAADDTELTFSTGDIFHVTARDDSGWWTGVLPNGTVGLFPGNYCEEISGDDANNAVNDSNNNGGNNNDGTGNDNDAAVAEGGDDNPNNKNDANANDSSGKSAVMATVQFDFQGEDESELSLTTGKVVKVFLQDESGWWHGEVDGKQGLFPAAYVVVNE